MIFREEGALSWIKEKGVLEESLYSISQYRHPDLNKAERNENGYHMKESVDILRSRCIYLS